jgi:hypothetical protein
VVTTLKGLLVGQPRLLQKINDHVSSAKFSGMIEVNTDEFSKTGGVVIPDSFGITPDFKHRVGLDNLVLKRCFTFLPLTRRADSSKVGADFFGVLGLSGTGLSSDEDGLGHTWPHIHW